MNRKTDINNFCAFVSVDKPKLRRFVSLLDAELPHELRAPHGTLSVAIFNDADLAKIHLDFMQNPAPTDVITFEGDEFDPDDAGEICASAETAFKNAPQFGNTASRELSLYVAHGYLHLAGVDDIAEEDAKKMRAAEALALEILDKHFKTPIFKYDAKKIG